MPIQGWLFHMGPHRVILPVFSLVDGTRALRRFMTTMNVYRRLRFHADYFATAIFRTVGAFAHPRYFTRIFRVSSQIPCFADFSALPSARDALLRSLGDIIDGRRLMRASRTKFLYLWRASVVTEMMNCSPSGYKPGRG